MKLKHALFVSLILHLIFLAVLVKTGILPKSLPEQQKAIVTRLIGPEEALSTGKKPIRKKKKTATKNKARKTKKQRKKIAVKKSKGPKKMLPEKGHLQLNKKKNNVTGQRETEKKAVEKQALLKEKPAGKSGLSTQKREPSEGMLKEEKGTVKGGNESHQMKRLLSPGELFDRDVIGNVAKRSIEKEKTRSNSGVTFSTRELKYYSYMMRLKHRIESIWVYPEEAARRGIYGDLWISFTIKKDGSLGEVKLLRTSGYPELDRAAMRALKDGAPYWPLPEKWKIDALTVKGHFIYNLYGMYIR